MINNSESNSPVCNSSNLMSKYSFFLVFYHYLVWTNPIYILISKSNQLGKAEVTTEDAITALKKAAKWAQMGLVVSTGPPVESGQADTPTGDKKNVRKQPIDVVCREKNTELARYKSSKP